MILTRISIGQPVFAVMVMLAITVLGLFSFQRLSIEQMPDVDFPVVAVVVSYPGASPEAVEADVVKPIEDAVNTLSGIDRVQSTSQAGEAFVLMIFDLEVDSASAAQDVRDRLAQVNGAFPDGVEDPTVLRFDPSDRPIMALAVSGGGLAARDLTALADDLILPRLSAVSGVGRATVVGGTSRQLNILIDPDRLTAFGIGVGEVTAALTGDNRDLPAGSVQDGRVVQTVQVEGRLEGIEDFLDLVIARRGDQPVRLGDVATVEDGAGEVSSLALLDGERALAINVVKTQGANTVEVARDLRAVVAAIAEADLPEGVDLQIVTDNATAVEDSYNGVQVMLIEGAILATLIVWIFLNSWRSTVITGLTLPISVIGTMTVLWAFGFTLNIMTLLALSLAIGLLIDDAIVVRENIMRHLAMGKSHRQAALDGTAEIGLAVLATTFSIVAVFLPVAFMEGIIGRFFLQFGVTVSVAVLISLFVSFTLDPMLSSVWYDPAAHPGAKRGPVGRLLVRFDRMMEAVARGYARVLRVALRWRKTTLALALFAFVGSFPLVPLVGVEFAPAVDESELEVTIETPVGSSLSYTEGKLRQVDRVLKDFPEVVQTYATVNAGTNQGGANSASVTVRLVPPDAREMAPADLTGPVRDALMQIPGIEATVGAAGGLGGISAPIEVRLSGESLSRLGPLADELARRLATIPGIEDVETSLELAQPILGVRVDRDLASDLGLSVAQVGQTLQPMLGGQTVGEWTSPEGLSYALNVQLPEDLREDPSGLGALPVARAGADGLVRLDQVAEIVESFGPAEITREGLARTITVSANLSGATLSDVTPQITAAVAALDLPPGYRATTGGDAADLAESGTSALQALLLAVIFIYLVLASQFGSFLQPVAIMLSLPLSLIGVMLGLLIGGSTLNMFSIIGFILLMGLVVKNAILLVDNANQQVREGVNLWDALVEAGQARFRPILMTTLAMILGMLPLALSIHEGSGQNAPMAHAVIGGLISSTILTLVVVPVALTYLDGLGRWAARWFRAPPDAAIPAEAPAPVSAAIPLRPVAAAE